MKKLLLTMMAALAVAFLAMPSAARADFEVLFTNGNGGSILVNDTTGMATASGGALLDGATINGTAVSGTSHAFTMVGGSLVISTLTVDPAAAGVGGDGNSKGFSITATVADSNSPGSPTVATIDLSSLHIKNQTGVAGNSTLTLKTGDTGFTMPNGASMAMVSTISATAGGLNTHNAFVTFNSYFDNTNAQFGTQQGTPTLNPSSPGGPGTGLAAGFSMSANSSGTVNGNPPNPYSLTQVLVGTVWNGDLFTDGSSGTTVFAPAPAGLMLVLSGLPFAGGLGLWRRFRKQA